MIKNRISSYLYKELFSESNDNMYDLSKYGLVRCCS